jgi:RimJ/RimL family protein N-acetyltransferase
MNLQIHQSELSQILPCRDLYLQAMNRQIRYNACHERGRSNLYSFVMDGTLIGYAAIKGKNEPTDRDCIFEFFLLPAQRKWASFAFQQLIQFTQAAYIECQSNDGFITPLLYEFAEHIRTEVILFEDQQVTDLKIPDVTFRPYNDDDKVFEHQSEPPGDYVLVRNNKVVATGGFLLHYNRPYADLYMEVNVAHRGKGFGSYLLQEIKKACYLAGRVPAARCNLENKASRACLEKAGMGVCGFMLEGIVKK